MSLPSFLSAILLFGIYACTTSSANSAKTKSTQNNSNQKVLVELFTSQGCSSCPPADKLISNLAQTDTDLIVLSFHVDYWDRLGWKDAFSNHAFTLRQEQYVEALHAESAYTPEAVVQGQFEMVGSNRNGISAALNKIKNQNNNVQLNATATVNSAFVMVHYEINEAKPNQQVLAALVQTHASTAIQRGENSGVQLEGYNVVRSFETIALAQKKGDIKLNLPPDLKRDNASVVV
ncbi:MAG: DUF1223 domain-containing protein, partial [Bacteroidota bacterium]|nr:DUF1223 domain-containing protein [Bacteroidota bacterium]